MIRAWLNRLPFAAKGRTGNLANVIGEVVDFSRRRAAWITIGMLVLTVIGAIFAAQNIKIDTDIDKLMSPDLQWRQREAEMERAFPQNVDLLVVVVDGDTPDRAEDASAELAEYLAKKTDTFKSVRRAASGEFFEREGLLFLSKQSIERVTGQIIAAQPLLGTLAADPSLRGVFDALDLAAQGVIHGETQPSALTATFNAVADATEASLNDRYAPLSWQRLLSGREPRPRELRRFILTKPILDYAKLTPGAKATRAVHHAAKQLGLTLDRGVRVRVTGPVALSDAEFKTLSRGAGVSSALSLGLLLLWLFLGLRSGRIVLAIVATLLVGLIACADFAIVAVGALNPISVAFAVLFVGIAVDFGIQFCLRYRDERYRLDDFSVALRRTARGIGRALAIAAAATAVGFFSFVPTDYTGVADLGLIAGFGMAIALVLNLTLLPALLSLLRPQGEQRPVGFAHAVPVGRFLVARRHWVLAAAGIVAIGAALLLPKLDFDFNPLHLQSPHEEAVSTLTDLMGDPDTTPYTIDVMTASPQAAVQLSSKIEELPQVARTVSIMNFVPTDQTDKLAAIADARQLLGPTLSPATVKPSPTPAEMLATIAKTRDDITAVGAKGEMAAQRLALDLDRVVNRGIGVLPRLEGNLSAGIGRRLTEIRLALSAQPVTYETLPADLKSDWVTADGRARIEVYPAGDARDNNALRQFASAVRRVAPSATGSPISIQESARTVMRAFVTAAIVAIAAIALLLILILRRLDDVLLVLTPLLLAGLLTLGTSVLAGLPLNFANIIALPLLLGIGVAFDIYFVMRWRDGQRELLGSSTARAILFSALTTGTAFGSLALSPHPGTSEMGRLLMLALLYTLICTFFVLPALLATFRAPPAPNERG
ncbi:MAG TPA: MMPL family transporter [Stellaceae bacterium]|nr:MMPL family transporter [Stellaceae bacterium]